MLHSQAAPASDHQVARLRSITQNKDFGPMDDIEGIGGVQPPSIDLVAILRGVLRRWKLVAAVTLVVSIATYGVVKMTVPSRFRSTVAILVYDPQQQIDTSIQKPVSPFVDYLNNDAINTEISILKSKSVALRVVSELGLDTDPEFQSQSLGIGDIAKQFGIVANRLGIATIVERLGIENLANRLGSLYLRGADEGGRQAISATEEKAEKLDRASEELIKKLDISQDAYIISVSATSRDPMKAQRLASAIADDYLASQREARQTALDHVATWLKGRVDNLQSRVSETEASIEELTAKSGTHDAESDRVREQQIRDLSTQLMTAREEVGDKSAHLEQARHVIDTNGDVDSIPELSASPALTELRRKKMELNWSLADLRNKFGEHNPQVVSARAALESVDKQIDAEAGKNILSVMKNAYDIAVRREQSLATNLQSLTANLNSETSVKLQQLRRGVDADRKDYESYLAQYNNIVEQREMQSASARVVSPANLPRSANSNRVKLYALGLAAGLGSGLLLAFLLEYFKPGVRNSTEIEQSFGRPVVGSIPLALHGRFSKASYFRLLDSVISEPLSFLSGAVHATRINLELSSANSKVILITSAVPGEGKSTAAMLLAASAASSGKRTILLDCDLRMRSISEALRRKNQLGLSELLRGTATLADVIVEDPVRKIHLIPAGSMAPNTADLLMSRGMKDLISILRRDFDCVLIDSPPLLPVVDALALATVADKILVVVEWGRTPRATISEAFRILGPEANRVAGVVLNKVDFHELPGYGGYQYRSIAKYYGSA
jgi:polysaccharide biosynthesis transport protein